ncbi:MAG TPA: hypothetical protein PKA55_21150 [Rhodoblastus sp.]|nr:hypothetical protein [Rhodoblastus sp.]
MTEQTADGGSADKGERKRFVREFLSGERTPIWYTLLLSGLGVIGAYVVAPSVNAQFEAQKLRTDFVIRNYNDLRAKMEDFQGLYVVAAQKVAGGQEALADVLKLQELVARVSAQNVALLPMFDNAAGPRAAAEVNAAMNGMLNVLFAHAGGKVETEAQRTAYNAEILKATQGLVKPLLELYVRIGEVGHLRPTEKDRDLAEK